MELRHDRADVWHLREDRGTVLSVHEGPAGSLLLSGYAARAGVLEYRDQAGRVTRELVPEQTLLDSAATLGRAPVTLQHPSEDVTPQNVDRLGIGDVDSQIDMAGGYVQVRVAVRRKDGIDAVRAGTVELSPGYRVQIDPTPGVDPVHGRYDAVQVRREVNHLALVDRARGGPSIRLRTDAAEATTPITAAPEPRHPEVSVKPHWLPILVRLGLTQRFDSDDAAAQAVDAELARRGDSTRADSATHATALATQTARADAAEARVKALELAEATRADAADRTALEPVATALGIDPKTCADAKTLRRSVATAQAKRQGIELRADASDERVGLLCDLAIAEHKGQGRADGAGVEAGRHVWDPPRHDDHDGDPARNDGRSGGRLGVDPRDMSENDRWRATIKTHQART